MRMGRFLIGCLVFSLGCSGKSAPEPVYIGHLASDNQPARNAILLAVEEANAAEGKVAGRPVAVLHPSLKDDADADRVALRLIAIDRVAALLAATGPAATAQLSRTAQQYGLPLVATVGPVSGTLPPYGFSVGLSPAARGKALARFLADALKKPGVGVVVHMSGPVTASVAAAFTEAYRAAGGMIDSRQEYKTSEELTSLLGKLPKNEARAVVFAGPVADFDRLREAKRGAGPVLYAGLDPSGGLPAAGSAESPVYRVTAFALDPALPRTKEFAEKYQGRFQHKPDAPAALAYDSARVLFDAMRRAGAFSGVKVREELLNTKDFESVTGPLSFDKAQNARRPAFVVRVEKAGERLEKRYDPE